MENKDKDKKNEDKMVEVPQKTLTEILEKISNLELEAEENKNRNAGLEELLRNNDTSSEPKIREKKSFEPKFRTVRLRKFPIAGDVNNLGYVIGYTSRGAYEEVDRSGVSPQVINYIDIIFLGNERNKGGKLQAEKVKLLDLMNKGVQVHCKILETKKELRQVPTGEEINVSIFDPAHGLIATGDIIDGYTQYTDITYQVQIPGVAEPVEVDALYCNN